MQVDRSITLSVLDELIKECHSNSKDKGFWDGKVPATCAGEKIALMHSELSEALEVCRFKSESNREQLLAEEFADCIIRIFDFAGAANLPLADELLRKMTYNRTRPPMHGKRF